MAILSGRAWFDERERELVARLDPGEVVLARGRFDEPNAPGRDLPTGGHRFLLVTDRRILWTDTSVDLATVTGYAEVTQFHRYAMRLRHLPVERRVRTAAHHVLWWRWGTATKLVQAVETTFVFSHRDTDAARAIRRRLSELGAERGEQITMPRARPRDRGKAYLQTATRRQRRRLRRTA